MTLTPQALEARQEWFRAHWKSRIAFNQLIGIEILDWEPGLVIPGHDFNRGSRLTTVSMNVQYMSVAPGEDLFAEGICTRRGRSLSFARVSVTSASGKLLAEGMLTVSIAGERTGAAGTQNGDPAGFRADRGETAPSAR